MMPERQALLGTGIWMFLLLSAGCDLLGEGQKGNEADADGDGVPAARDCDDANPLLRDRAEDGDCDGVVRAEDCDDADVEAGSRALDADCDGHLVDQDCDDFDPGSDTRLEDGDCDGLRTAEDCNDTDETVPADDADCDGLRTAEDCNDTEATMPAEDADCDGALTAEDCDDTNPLYGAQADDADCDGAVTAVDCDDTDPALGDRALDADCDGFPTAEDCDDEDPGLPASDDADCDGATVDVDCSDYNPAIGSVRDDADCDGVVTSEDCDDTDPDDTRSNVGDADCDNVATADDCDDTDPTIPWIDDWDCDGVMTHPGGGDMVRVSGGTFDMGYRGTERCDQDLDYWCWHCGEDLHEVTLTRDYFVGVTEFTRAEYEVVTGNPASTTSGCSESDCPATYIYRVDIYKLLNSMSVSNGFTECYAIASSGYWEPIADFYACDGYRLPTDAEWERAARCGTATEWAGSNRPSTVSVHDVDAPVPVASLAPNACGLYDMSGNAGETVNDNWNRDYYDGAASTDPMGPAFYYSAYSVIRGGKATLSECYTATHIRERDDNRIGSDDGFRVVRTAPDSL